MVPADSRRIPRVPRYSGAVWPRSAHFAYGAVTLFGQAFLPVPLCADSGSADGPTTPGGAQRTPPVWAPARSLATTCAIIVIFFSSGYLDVSVPRVRPPRLTWCARITPGGFPHSDIRGSQGICPSPRLFAACHVLPRLREPQASPMRPLCLSLCLQERGLRADCAAAARPLKPSRPSESKSLDRSLNSISSLRFQDSRAADSPLDP